jgi:hypothetical protein
MREPYSGNEYKLEDLDGNLTISANYCPPHHAIKKE